MLTLTCVLVSLARSFLLARRVSFQFINARMRYWRPMLRSQQALLASGMKIDDLREDADSSVSVKQEESPASPSPHMSLSDLSSVAASATPSASCPAAGSAGSILTSEVFHQKLTDLVPRSGRSYMVLDGSSKSRSKQDISALTGIAAGASAGAAAEIIAASTLALQMATNYQTPHSYISSHPLHKGKYKSGGKSRKAEAGGGASQKKKVAIKKEKV